MPNPKANDSGLSVTELSQLLDQKLDPIKDNIAALKGEVTQLKEQMSSLITEAQVKAIVGKATEDLKKENNFLRDKIDKLENQQNEKLLSLESQQRRNNLKFHGIEEKVGENWSDSEEKVKSVIDQLGLDSQSIHIERAHRIGPSAPSSARAAPRPIIARFLTFKDREAVLHKYWQKEVRENIGAVRITEDYPAEIEMRRSKLLPYFYTARHQKVASRLAIDKLTIDKVTYTIENINEIPEQYHPQHTKDVGENATAFYHSESPFSNFHQATFSIRSKVFSSVEQYFQYSKATLFEDQEKADEIMNTQDPATIKSIARNIKGFKNNVWKQHRVRIMKEALHAKFDQNPSLKEKLALTRNKTLIEASPRDLYWGAGLSLHNPKLADSTCWRGQNKLGILLCELRMQLCG